MNTEAKSLYLCGYRGRPQSLTFKNMSEEIKQELDAMRAEQRQILLLYSKDVFTVEELGMYTGLKKSYIYKLVCLKKIPYYKGQGGKCVYFKKSEINDWMCSQRFKTVEEMQSEAACYVAKNPTKGGRK